MVPSSTYPNYYSILQISVDADFRCLKRAYFTRAKECHPDLHHGSPEKEEEFKRLVEAFDVLSDPLKRREFDRQQRFERTVAANDKQVFHFQADAQAIMDSLADDTLEELIVGNTLPLKTTLQTLMLDLERTELFCLYREAKTCYYHRRYQHARLLFEKTVRASPYNIIYRYYLGKSLIHLDHLRTGIKELEAAVQLGAARRPPQRLTRIRRELERYRLRRQTVLGRWRRRLCKEIAPDPEASSPEAMRQKLGRAMMRLQKDTAKPASDHKQRRRRLLE